MFAAVRQAARLMGFRFDRMGSSCRMRSWPVKIWRGTAMDFYEALQQKPHPLGVTPSLWRYLAKYLHPAGSRKFRPA